MLTLCFAAAPAKQQERNKSRDSTRNRKHLIDAPWGNSSNILQPVRVGSQAPGERNGVEHVAAPGEASVTPRARSRSSHSPVRSQSVPAQEVHKVDEFIPGGVGVPQRLSGALLQHVWKAVSLSCFCDRASMLHHRKITTTPRCYPLDQLPWPRNPRTELCPFDFWQSYTCLFRFLTAFRLRCAEALKWHILNCRKRLILASVVGATFLFSCFSFACRFIIVHG